MHFEKVEANYYKSFVAQDMQCEKHVLSNRIVWSLEILTPITHSWFNRGAGFEDFCNFFVFWRSSHYLCSSMAAVGGCFQVSQSPEMFDWVQVRSLAGPNSHVFEEIKLLQV